MEPTEAAILRTILYADVFGFPLNTPEIHHFLISPHPIPYDKIHHTLHHSPLLHRLLTHQPPYYALATRQEIISTRQAKDAVIQRLLPKAQYYGRWLARLPFVRMVALTGALAVRNPNHDRDDIDYFIVTEPGRVWFTRAACIALVRLARLRGIELCPNYVLAANQLKQNHQTLFISREITQMNPIYGEEVYTAFMEANRWIQNFQPNAKTTYYNDQWIAPDGWHRVKQLTERLLRGWLGYRLEKWEYQRKSQKFMPQIKKIESNAQIDEGHVKGHFNDYGNPTLAAYQERLHQHGLEYEDITLANAGD